MAARQNIGINNASLQTDSGLEKTGTIKPWPSDTIPTGWIKLDGTEISRNTYSNLFNILGENYGAGDGILTFNVPNLCGRTPIGAGDYLDPVFGIVTNTLGVSGGNEKHALSSLESGLLGHWHDITTITTSVGNHQHYTMRTTNASSSLMNPGKVLNNIGSSGIQGYSLRMHQVSATIGKTSSAGSHSHTLSGYLSTSGSANASSAHENMQPYIVQNWIIKA